MLVVFHTPPFTWDTTEYLTQFESESAEIRKVCCASSKTEHEKPHRSDEGEIAAEDDISDGTNNESICDQGAFAGSDFLIQCKQAISQIQKKRVDALGIFSHEYTSSTLMGPCAFQLTAAMTTDVRDMRMQMNKPPLGILADMLEQSR